MYCLFHYNSPPVESHDVSRQTHHVIPQEECPQDMVTLGKAMSMKHQTLVSSHQESKASRKYKVTLE